MKYHVFGDTGGHKLPLLRSLIDIGVDVETHTIPEDVTIIHLGDLIHKGPDTESLVMMVNSLMRANPNRWVQILGNHEFQHLGGPSFWRCDCSPATVAIMKEWKNEGLARISYGLDNIKAPNLEVSARPKMLTNSDAWVFTHAGVSYDWWTLTGEKTTGAEIAEALNNVPVKQITTPGEMLFCFASASAKFPPGPVWAIGNSEVFNSWHNRNITPTFNQVHGHTTSFHWRRKNWGFASGPAFRPFREKTKVNPDLRAAITDLGDNTLMVGIDPGYDKYADQKKQPYLTLEDNND